MEPNQPSKSERLVNVSDLKPRRGALVTDKRQLWAASGGVRCLESQQAAAPAQVSSEPFAHWSWCSE